MMPMWLVWAMIMIGGPAPVKGTELGLVGGPLGPDPTSVSTVLALRTAASTEAAAPRGRRAPDDGAPSKRVGKAPEAGSTAPDPGRGRA